MNLFVYRYLTVFAFIFTVSLSLSGISIAQNEEISIRIIDSLQMDGTIKIEQDSSVLRLLNNQVLLNQQSGGIPNGYRIQVFSASGNDAREKAINFKELFLENHPDFDREEIYQLYTCQRV